MIGFANRSVSRMNNGSTIFVEALLLLDALLSDTRDIV